MREWMESQHMECHESAWSAFITVIDVVGAMALYPLSIRGQNSASVW